MCDAIKSLGTSSPCGKKTYIQWRRRSLCFLSTSELLERLLGRRMMTASKRKARNRGHCWLAVSILMLSKNGTEYRGPAAPRGDRTQWEVARARPWVTKLRATNAVSEEGCKMTGTAYETPGVQVKHAHFPMLTTNVPGTGGTSVHSRHCSTHPVHGQRRGIYWKL